MNTYILFQDSNHSKFLILDQHAAHERINFEKFLSEFKKGKPAAQELLIPQIIQLSPSDYSTALDEMEKFQQLGFDIRDGNFNSIIINAVPVILTDADIRDVFYSIFDGTKNYEYEDIIRKACKASVKAGDIISAAEADNLVKLLMQCQNKDTCPHGRPIRLDYTKYEIKKFIKRIQDRRN